MNQAIKKLTLIHFQAYIGPSRSLQVNYRPAEGLLSILLSIFTFSILYKRMLIMKQEQIHILLTSAYNAPVPVLNGPSPRRGF